MIGGMDRKECPKWLSDIGWWVDELIREPKNRDRFRKELRDWYNDNAHKSEYRLLPLEPRKHSLREMYVVLSAIHDCCCREVKSIHPWSKLPQTSTVGTKYFGLMGDVPRLLTQKNDNLVLESFLDSVNRDLPVKIESAETGQGIEKIGHMEKERDAASEICSEEEFRQFASIHKRLTALQKEFYEPIEKRYDGFSLRRIDIDEDISTFWPTMKKIGQKVGVDLPDTPALIKAIIYEEEITSPYLNLADYCGTGGYIDGKYVDEIELAEMAKEDIEEREKPRYELSEKIDKIMVRLCKHFDVQPNEDQNTECHNANGDPRPETTSETESKPKPPGKDADGETTRRPKPLDSADRWITITKAAEMLGKNAGTVSRWVDEEKIKNNGKKKRERRVLKSSVLLMKDKIESEDQLRDSAEILRDMANEIPDEH